MPPIRVAILGCGSYAGIHAGRMRDRDDVEVVACCDLREEIVQGFIAKHLPDAAPPPAVFTDVSRTLAQAKPDAVFICTPHTLHSAHAMAALDGGCHVFIEKPMVTSSADAHALRDRAAEAGRVVVVGYNTPCTGEFQYLRRAILDPHGPTGLGDLRIVTGYLAQNWARWCKGTWRQDPAMSGGGILYDTGAHLLASLCWSVGEHVREVFAMLDEAEIRRSGDQEIRRSERNAQTGNISESPDLLISKSCLEINGVIAVRFANGVLASLAVAGDCPTDGSHLSFCFGGGRIDIDGWYGSWINVHNAYGRVKYPAIANRAATPDDNFIEAIHGKAKPVTTAEHGVIQSELMDAIYESARTGAVVRL